MKVRAPWWAWFGASLALMCAAPPTCSRVVEARVATAEARAAAHALDTVRPPRLARADYPASEARITVYLSPDTLTLDLRPLRSLRQGYRSDSRVAVVTVPFDAKLPDLEAVERLIYEVDYQRDIGHDLPLWIVADAAVPSQTALDTFHALCTRPGRSACDLGVEGADGALHSWRPSKLLGVNRVGSDGQRLLIGASPANDGPAQTLSASFDCGPAGCVARLAEPDAQLALRQVIALGGPYVGVALRHPTRQSFGELIALLDAMPPFVHAGELDRRADPPNWDSGPPPLTSASRLRAAVLEGLARNPKWEGYLHVSAMFPESVDELDIELFDLDGQTRPGNPAARFLRDRQGEMQRVVTVCALQTSASVEAAVGYGHYEVREGRLRHVESVEPAAPWAACAEGLFAESFLRLPEPPPLARPARLVLQASAKAPQPHLGVSYPPVPAWQ